MECVANIEEGLNLHRAGRLSDAESIYRRILDRDPHHADALHLLGVMKGNASLIRRAIELRPLAPDYHGNLGNLLHSQGQFEAAIVAFIMAVRLAPDRPELLNNLGNALREAGRSEQAVAVLTQAVQLKPDLAESHDNLALALAGAGQLDAAIATSLQAIRLRPDYAEAHYNLGNVLQKKGRIEDAIASYQRAMEIRPDYSPAHYNLGVAFAEKGAIDQAINSYQRALAINGECFQAHNNLGNALQEKGEIDQAIACFRRALEIKGDFAVAHYNLGMALRDGGQFNEAIAAFRQALAFHPDYVRAQYELADALMMNGQFCEALTVYTPVTRPSLEIDPAPESSSPRLPYIGDRVVLLSCSRSICQTLQSMGLGIMDPAGLDGIENLSPESVLAKLGRDLVVHRNAMAMAGILCGVWMEAMPKSIARAIRHLAGTDLLEVTAASVAEAARQIKSHAEPLPNTAGKVFAVCSTRNGAVDLLPHWLEHYNNLGVDKVLIGLFDCISPEVQAQIDDLSTRWSFTCFKQTWNGTGELFHEEQRRAACRSAGALPGTWILHTDLDEFDEFPRPLPDITFAADARGIKAIFGWFIDRVAADGSLPPVRQGSSLFSQFPVSCRLTARVLRGGTQKIMLARYDIPVNCGHHSTDKATPGGIPLGRPEEYIVHHFKWHADFVPRVQYALSRPDIPRRWRNETMRFLTWLDANGGKIKLDDSIL